MPNNFLEDLYSLFKRYNLTFIMIILVSLSATVAIMPQAQELIKSPYSDLMNITSDLAYSSLSDLSQAELLDLRNETTKAIVNNNSKIPLGEKEFYMFDGIIEGGNASLFTLYNTTELNLERSNNYTNGNFTVQITKDHTVKIFADKGEYW